ncbi:hypothetical protein [Carboxylicivirga sp. M1479]|uniref:hypothetical protein n=1 Tax=Carboxylicivirga sp. M1479 TaxID=2594476 RepID=UPI001177AED7|nr:hypothetical protein [Carboxylicivirga sp. M1479]TRX71525.1 hypothetical protein FNN09_06020 [Carboxylicivirga sp. M1479]
MSEKENLKKYKNAEKLKNANLGYDVFNGNEVGRIVNNFITTTKQAQFYYRGFSSEISVDNTYKFLRYLFKFGRFTPEQLDHVIKLANDEKDLKELDLLDKLEEQQKQLADKIAKIKEKKTAKGKGDELNEIVKDLKPAKTEVKK